MSLEKDLARFTDPVIHVAKLAWSRARGALLLGACGAILWIFAFWEQVLPQYSYSPGYSVPQSNYTAGAMHSLCVLLGSSANFSVASVCNQAASAEADKGHAFLAGLVLIVAAVVWANHRFGWVKLPPAPTHKYGEPANAPEPQKGTQLPEPTPTPRKDDNGKL